MIENLETRIQSISNLVGNIQTFPKQQLIELAQIIVKTFTLEKKIAFVGNGGSAAEASHIAAEFVGKCVNNHAPLPAISLNDSQSIITAVGNDFGFHEIFARQALALLNEGDVLVALSTSGTSKNILKALSAAKSNGVFTVLWSGECSTPADVDLHMKVPSKSTPRIQEIHLMWGHLIAEIVEIHNF